MSGGGTGALCSGVFLPRSHGTLAGVTPSAVYLLRHSASWSPDWLLARLMEQVELVLTVVDEVDALVPGLYGQAEQCPVPCG